MVFRKFDSVLSEEFEWSKLLAAINYYINEMQLKGIDTREVAAVKDKLIYFSETFEKSVNNPF